MNCSKKFIDCILEERIDLGIKPGLERIQSILSKFINIHSPPFFVIQIAGTNGKGTVCSLLEKYFLLNNISCGVFTSPHIERVNERIKVDGVEISNFDLEKTLKYIESVEETSKLTYFEVLTAGAVKYFFENKVQVVVLETGMGGRLDSCTAIDKDIAVITQIDLDHCQFLGDTIEKIFYEKIAIADNAKSVLMLNQPHSNLNNLYDNYIKKNIKVEKIDYQQYSCSAIDFKPESFKKNFFTFYSIAVELHNLGLIPQNGSEQIDKFEKCIDIKVKGRLDTFSYNDKTVIVDVSHNPAGVENLVNYVKKSYPEKKFNVVFGSLVDKNYTQMIDILLKVTKKMYIFSCLQTVNADAKRAFADISPALIEKRGIEWKKIDIITKELIDDDTIVCGSFKLAGDIYGILSKKQA